MKTHYPIPTDGTINPQWLIRHNSDDSSELAAAFNPVDSFEAFQPSALPHDFFGLPSPGLPTTTRQGSPAKSPFIDTLPRFEELGSQTPGELSPSFFAIGDHAGSFLSPFDFTPFVDPHNSRHGSPPPPVLAAPPKSAATARAPRKAKTRSARAAAAKKTKAPRSVTQAEGLFFCDDTTVHNCGKGYSRLPDLQRHIDTALNKLQRFCYRGDCDGKKFARPDALKRHVTVCHED